MAKRKEPKYISRVNRVRPDGRHENYFYARFLRGHGIDQIVEAQKCFPVRQYGGVRKAKLAAQDWVNSKLRRGIRKYARLDQAG